MSEKLFDFTAIGSPRAVSREIEVLATGLGSLTAIVVPWESDDATLSIAVTSTKADGWAIEHTNLGTIRLTALGNESTRVEISAEKPDHPENNRLVALFGGFASQVQSKFQVAR
jgi:hypothetical protein